MSDTAQAQTEPAYLPASTGCGDEFKQLEWTGTLTVRVDETTLVGIQFNDTSLQDAVAVALGDRLYETDQKPRPNFSVRLGTPGRRKAAPLHFLYAGPKPVLGTRDVRRLVRGLENHLSHLIARHDAGIAQAVPVQTPQGVLLAPTALLGSAKIVDRVLLPAGLLLADVPVSRVDLAAATVTVPEPVLRLDVDPDLLASVGGSVQEPRIEPGTYPLSAWIVPVSLLDDVGPLRRAKAVFYAGQLVNDVEHRPQGALQQLAALAERIPVSGVSTVSDEGVVAAVVEAAGA